MNEEQFWRCTPRKLFALLEAHNRANAVDEAEKPQAQKMTLEDLRSLQTVRK